VSEFVDECRREWSRLGVPVPIANEMAADLSADLEEAEAEGGSPEDVLGNSAFDPRRFAAAWATARGVTGPPISDRPSWRRSPIAIAVSLVLGVLVIGAGFVLLVGLRGHSSVAFAAQRIVAGPGPIPGVAPGRRIMFGGPLMPLFVRSHIAGIGLPIVGLGLLMIGIVVLGLIAVLHWSPWSGSRRYRQIGSRH
jgi:hypothetical protein